VVVVVVVFKVRVNFHTTETELLPCKTFTSLKGEITSLKFQPWPWYHLYKEGMCICFSNKHYILWEDWNS